MKEEQVKEEGHLFEGIVGGLPGARGMIAEAFFLVPRSAELILEEEMVEFDILGGQVILLVVVSDATPGPVGAPVPQHPSDPRMVPFRNRVFFPRYRRI